MALSQQENDNISYLEECRTTIRKEFDRLEPTGALEQFTKVDEVAESFDMYSMDHWTETEEGGYECVIPKSAITQVAGEPQNEPKPTADVCIGKPADMKVYFRFRPLIGSEVERSDAEIKREITQEEDSVTLIIETEKKGKARQRIRPLRKKRKQEPHVTEDAGLISINPPARNTQKWTGAGFCRGFEGSDNNESVFSNSIKTQLDVILKGGTLSCFAYGHTESGKTHTQLGYGDEKGMFYLTARELCKQMEQLNKESDVGAKIEVRFFELHNKKVYDLLNNRTEGFIREGKNKEVLIRGKTEHLGNGRVRVCPLWSKTCSTADEVEEAVKHGVSLRKVGSSTLHDKSSRSHAFIELEIVNDKIIKARKSVIEMESEMTFLGKMSTDLYLEAGRVAFHGFKKREDGNYGTKVAKDVPIAMLFSDRKKGDVVTKYYEHLFKKEKEHCQKILEEQKGISAMFGGRALFVDLAGSEHGSDKSAQKQSRDEQREGKEINMSLLALNEVFRKQMIGEKRIPFRESRLTMVMREYLTSEICATMMIANVSPSKEHAAKTLKTMRYALNVAKTHRSEKKEGINR